MQVLHCITGVQRARHSLPPVPLLLWLSSLHWGLMCVGPHSNLCEEDIGRALAPFRCTHTETYRHIPKHVHFVVKLKLLWNVGHVLKCGQNAVISSTCCGRDGERGSRHRAEKGFVFVVELMPRDTHLDEHPSPQPWIWMSRALLCYCVYIEYLLIRKLWSRVEVSALPIYPGKKGSCVLKPPIGDIPSTSHLFLVALQFLSKQWIKQVFSLLSQQVASAIHSTLRNVLLLIFSLTSDIYPASHLHSKFLMSARNLLVSTIAKCPLLWVVYILASSRLSFLRDI